MELSQFEDNQRSTAMDAKRVSLSVTIITKNEEARLVQCLKSIETWVDEIIILDSGSTDKTVQIAGQYTKNVYHADWPGYGKQKQRALDYATSDWVLSLDADEIVTDGLRDEILKLINQEEISHDGYRISRIMVIQGKPLKRLQDGSPLRLFKRDKARFSTAMVHEGVELIEGNSGKLKNAILHDSMLDLASFIDKRNRYALIWAQQELLRNNIQSSLFKAFYKAIWRFVVTLLYRKAFLHGAPAVLCAGVLTQYTFNKYLILFNLQKERRRTS